MIDAIELENVATQALFESFSNPELLVDLPISSEVKSEISSYHADLSSQPVIILGRLDDPALTHRVVSWISVLHFERNLGNALDAMTACEAALAQLLNVQVMYSQLQDGLALSEQKQLVELLKDTFIRKRLELFEYTKAVKIGLSVCAGYTFPNLEPDLNLPSSKKTLLSISDWTRTFLRQDTETVIPVSAKHAQNSLGQHVSNWKTDLVAPRENADPLQTDLLELNLNQMPEFMNQENFRRRILGVGISVIDKSSLAAPSNAERPHRDRWNMVLRDVSGGVKISPTHFETLPDIPFNGAGGYEIVWSRTEKIINFSPDRKWEIKVPSRSLLGKGKDEIQDIIVHFHVAEQRT
ncbi:hypothetical protein N6L27_23115 [Leisingera sp. SS27]|uniref:hypothetical protein n=1 Tax=Leisingera sp. SS27 TaxID=2979462 RepID=UPI00232EB95E|nr:hypothetical protein [Leisingera sp. SS27]MDC0660906.1 hypothetical protein [Leisingera sp. SS27]